MTLLDLPILTAWHAFGGGPLRGKRGRAFWRHGNGYKVAIDQERGVWYHHVTGVGGGPK